PKRTLAAGFEFKYSDINSALDHITHSAN
ncbi:MAG TPA: hypothetical protein DDW91_16480, partial [Shewanella frigidimarina]|nr:hypothetical protein [Shewanella frigidimarina]